ncbi:MAG: hypothetical protein KH230_08950 [Enterocloster asparagiformis]|nr:hypothetical protein [Enterocloster asparagiformis]
MAVNKIPFQEGTLETLIERLYQTMDSMDKHWSESVVPASQGQIEELAKQSGLDHKGKGIPAAYLLFLRAMGQCDNGLLEQQWDGSAEVGIDDVLEGYLFYKDDFDVEEYMPFSLHWTEAILFLKLTEGENPPVYYNGKLFSGSFENYLFQMAYKKMEEKQFLYRTELAASKQQLHEILSRGSEQDIDGTRPMKFIEHILAPYHLQKLWFSDEIHFYGISPELIVSVHLDWALNIIISSDNHAVFQSTKANLTHLLGVS